MNNGVIVVVLGIALAMCTVLDELALRVEEREKEIESAQTVMVQAFPEDNSSVFFEKYDINELSRYYPAPKFSDGKVLIEVPVINQYPELPTGCEITSVTAVLNYLGYKVDKVYMQENYLEDSYNFVRIDEDTRTGPDPYKVFVGNPKDTGFGCYAPVVADTIDKYFISVGSPDRAVNVEDADQSVLELLIDNGIPVIVWASIDMKPYLYTKNNEWILNTTGETFRWRGNSHVLVLVGYDEDNYYFSDCNDREEYAVYPKQLFLKRWEQNEKQGVIIKLGEQLY